MDTSQTLPYWLGFNALGLGYPTIHRLHQINGDIRRVWHASAEELIANGLKKSAAERFVERRDGINLEKLLTTLRQTGVEAIAIDSPLYPTLLKQIASPPPILFFRGQLAALQSTTIAVVGSRKPIDYGRRVTVEFVTQLVNAGVTIVSGLAIGIDTIAHRAALAAGGTTIGVLGSGLCQIHPRSNQSLVREIVTAGGLVLSEFPLSAEPLHFHFPQRNQTIAGISQGILVTQAAEKSGSLLTAQAGAEYNRAVFGVPGEITQVAYTGSHRLLQSGAHLVTSVEDICSVLGIPLTARPQNSQPMFDSPLEEKVYKSLSRQPLHIDKIIGLVRLDISTLNATLTTLEINGLIKDVGGQHYYQC